MKIQTMTKLLLVATTCVNMLGCQSAGDFDNGKPITCKINTVNIVPHTAKSRLSLYYLKINLTLINDNKYPLQVEEVSLAAAMYRFHLWDQQSNQWTFNSPSIQYETSSADLNKKTYTLLSPKSTNIINITITSLDNPISLINSKLIEPRYMERLPTRLSCSLFSTVMAPSPKKYELKWILIRGYSEFDIK